VHTLTAEEATPPRPDADVDDGDHRRLAEAVAEGGVTAADI
jgi:hypothetical protein